MTNSTTLNIPSVYNVAALNIQRSLKLYQGQGRYAIPSTTEYQPVHNFLNHFGNTYPFQMLKLLHVAGVKMMRWRVNAPYERTLFATGGLYLALDQDHADLRIQRTFGDFTSGFSHQFGVAIALMTMSQAYQVPWNKLHPIPVKGRRELDYKARLVDSTGHPYWLMVEAKGVTTESSRRSAKVSAYGKKLKDPKNLNSAKRSFKYPAAMISVITQAARKATESGIAEIIDPPFDFDPTEIREENILAGRNLHYAQICLFAGLYKTAFEFIDRANQLIAGQRPNRRALDIVVGKDEPLTIGDRSVVGVQWQLSNGYAPSDVWLYHGVELQQLQKLIAHPHEIPLVRPFSAPEVRIEQQSQTHVDSFLPDGSFFGIGIEPRDGLVIVDPRETDFDNRQIDEIVYA